MFWFILSSQQFFWWNQIFKHHHEIICQMELSFPLNTASANNADSVKCEAKKVNMEQSIQEWF